MLKPLFFVSALVLFGVSATSNAGPAPQENSQPAATDQANFAKLHEKVQARTKELYKQECALCHGDAGNGKSDLATAAKLTCPKFRSQLGRRN